MTRLEDRQALDREIEQAQTGGARLAEVCALAGLDPRTVQRWRAGDGLTRGDRRLDAVRPALSHALTEAEQARIVAVANQTRFADTPPARIVLVVADESVYIGGESSFRRVLRVHGQMNRRGRAHRPRKSPRPTTHIATQPGEVCAGT
jgi:putative transposase